MYQYPTASTRNAVQVMLEPLASALAAALADARVPLPVWFALQVGQGYRDLGVERSRASGFTLVCVVQCGMVTQVQRTRPVAEPWVQA